jgi:alginate O-acetyltransferase complex protein AlgI
MNFTETPFWILSVVVFGLWLLCRRHYAAKLGLLLTASMVFYSYHLFHRHQEYLLLLILAYCLVDWWVGRRLVRSERPQRVLALGVAFNLIILGYWKYTPLLLRTAAKWALAFDLPSVPAPTDDWVIPFGISFYAFTGIAYMVDVYRGITPAETSLLRYSLSVMFFPHLVAGPILRPDDFLTKLRPDSMPERPEAPLEVLTLLARGFFKKMVLADRIAVAIDPFFAHVGDASTAGVWALPYAYLYAFQIYFDFSGYTDIARGLGLSFGFRWPENFNRPYLAASIQEFWRRWHITLSLFLRDYLYIPLGGNRRGPWRTNLNLMITMLLGGLWHGASWSFMLWGGLHGTYLWLNRLWSGWPVAARLQKTAGMIGFAWRLVCVAVTFHCVCLAWCFFRLNVLTDSLTCVSKWVVFDSARLFVGGSSDLAMWILLAMYGLVSLVASSTRTLSPWSQDETRQRSFGYGFRWGFATMLLVLAVLLSPTGEKPPFIYFQF